MSSGERRLTVLHSESSPSLGGQELRILVEMEALVKHGIDSVLIARSGGAILDEARQRGLVAYPVSMRNNLHPPTLQAVWRLLKRHRVDVVNAHNSKDAWNVAPVARALGIPVVRSRHIASAVKPGWLRTLPYGALCDAVTTTSGNIRDGLVVAGVDAGKISVVPTGIIAEHYERPRDGAFRNELGIPPDAPLIGQIAVLRKDKGGDIFARAALQLLESGLDAWFVLVGDGRLRQTVESLVPPAWKSRLILTGYRRDVPAILAELDVFVLAARSPEGVPQAILQAHAARIPVVATTVGGVNEVAIANETALAIPPEDPAALAIAVCRLLADRPLGRRLAEAGHRLMLDRYTLERMAATMAALYRSLAR